MNIATTQTEVVADSWAAAVTGFDTFSEAAKNATELLTVREAQEQNDELEAVRLSFGI